MSYHGRTSRSALGTTLVPADLRSVVDMTWSQLHERMAFMADMVERAITDPDGALESAAGSDDVRRLFGDEEGMLLSLRHRWVNMLAAKLDQAVHDGTPAEQARADLAAANPGLRALLDAAARRSVRVRALDRGEQHMVDIYTGPRPGDQTVA